ncbi:MAG: hypothetical protein KUG77_08385, partial [Nannocystaceae bacterium]|nr:hypothetical protein [Nannocystaceae bacterium]
HTARGEAEGTMKTAAQTHRAMAQREANDQAKAAGEPMPHANPWDSLMQKLPEGASREERRRWYAEFAERHAPR